MSASHLHFVSDNLGNQAPVSVCSPSKRQREENLCVPKSRWDETEELLDFDELPLFRATPPSEDEEHAAVLTLHYFVQNPLLEFPSVLISKTRKMPLRIENPRENDQVITFARMKCSSAKGFFIVPRNSGQLVNFLVN